MDSYFCARDDLARMGFKSLGENVLISRKSSIYAPELISIGSNVRIDDFVFLSGDITLHNHIHIAPFCVLIGGTNGAGIVMRDYSGLSGHVSVYSISDDYSGDYMTNPTIPEEFLNILRARVTIGRYVVVGTMSVLLPGIEIGEGAAVGAMSLVSRSLPAWKICGGSPARPLKDRNRGLLELEQQYKNKYTGII